MESVRVIEVVGLAVVDPVAEGFGVPDDAVPDPVTVPVTDPVDVAVPIGACVEDALGAPPLALSVGNTEADAAGASPSFEDAAHASASSANAQPHHTRCLIAPRP